MCISPCMSAYMYVPECVCLCISDNVHQIRCLSLFNIAKGVMVHYHTNVASLAQMVISGLWSLIEKKHQLLFL